MSALHGIKKHRAEIDYVAPPPVREAIAAIGRTEDIRFSPANRRLAVAAFNLNRVAVFDVDVSRSGAQTSVSLTGVVEIASKDLNRPHGVDFIDDDTLIVANRTGDASIFALPVSDARRAIHDLSAIHVMRVREYCLLASPGSVGVLAADRHRCDILICNNSGNTVTRHGLDRSAGYAIDQGRVLVQRWLDIPDGVSVSRDRRWMAVSNHNTHNVLMYENPEAMNADAEPDGILRGIHCPHGLRFSGDGTRIFVADAGAPYIHVFASSDGGWRGVRRPITSFRVMEQSQFLRGRHNPQEGGPKGLDIDDAMNVLVVTSECQPIAFFDPAVILEGAREQPRVHGDQSLRIRYQLQVVGRGWKVARWAQSTTAEARARVAPVVRGLLSGARTANAPLRRKS
jgi:DNA-binding beta-propeller fold protein YncE